MDNSLERFFWNQIEDMNFNERGHKGAGEYLVNETTLSFKGMKEVRNFVFAKASELYNKFDKEFRGSDDGFSDVVYQVIANGEEAFNNITIEELQSMYDENRYTESFAYAFHIIDEMEDEEKDNALVKAENRLEDIRRGYGGGFMTKLVAAFDHADGGNKRKLAKGFPELFGPLVD